jgi:EAL domain-containing protein (putative c-di-GMP-specific phosphodiesterase class I)
MEQGLRLALARDELYLVYQPLVELRSGRIAGVEALLRWRSAEMGLIGPNKFIPVAERCGLIVPIGQWVLETACRTNRQWQAEGLPWFPVSVNISAKQLQVVDFVDTVEDVLRQTGLSPQLLELELTESTAMGDVEHSQEVLSRLKDLGVRVVVDDFGTGYSSLVRMKLIPMDAVKVDRSFIEHIAEDPRDRALVMAIVALARNFGVEVVAEGVETREQLEVLRSFEDQPANMFHCDKIQGNFFSCPIAPEEIPALFERHGDQSGGRSWYTRHTAGGSI